MSRVEKAAARAIGVGVLLGAVLAAAAHAAPVTWTLTGVTFDDGSTQRIDAPVRKPHDGAPAAHGHGKTH